jgi:ATP-dependent Clp protease ATP-binding subunit ClpC
MDKYNLVPRLKKSIEASVELANKYKHQRINNAHLLYCIIENCTVQIKTVFTHYHINTEILKSALLNEYPQVNPSVFKRNKNEDWWSPEFEFLLQNSYDLARELGQEFIGIEHVLYTLFFDKSELRDYLISKDIPLLEIADSILSLLNPNEEATFENESEKTKKNEQQEEKVKYSVKYCHNLNELVKKQDGKIEGRDLEIDKLIEILSCKVKNNAVLVGDAGVGKTAIVEGLAQRINDLNCPIFFSGYKILSLDLGLMLAGTKYRGQFEERFKGLLDELKKDNQSILFIDEVHSIVGAGSTEGTLDLANMIKPALARGEIKCIGATTHMEYKKYFEKDSALNRRFQLLNIDEPNKVQTFEILKKAKNSYENFHGVTYSDEIIDNIINLSEKYMPYRKFPDKAFDILDRIGATGKIEKYKVPDKLKKIETSIIQNLNENDLKTKEQQDQCQKMVNSFLTKRNSWLKKTSQKIMQINEEHILDAFAKITGMKKEKLKINSTESVITLKEDIKLKIFDQSEVIDKIYDILLCAKAGIKQYKKTLANLLFVGSTGVGKTYTAKVIAEKFFNKPNSFLQIDMAEYVEKNSISKLIGATAGYVGYEEGGLLSEFVRNNPCSLILFDEVEKAHPDIVNILLKIMDEGVIIDNFNRKIDFTNTIIVLTGNIGAEFETQKSMGFMQQSQENRSGEYLKSVKKFFKPELISRLDEILIFNNKFSKEGLTNMMSSSINEIEESLAIKNIKLNVNLEIQNHLLSLIEKEGNNARSVQKVLRNTFELPLCKFIVSNQNLKEISSKVVDNQIVFM